MSNKIGEKFQITSFGSSHGVAVGAVVDGCPANLELTQEDIQKELDKRKPGQSSITTQRKEEELLETEIPKMPCFPHNLSKSNAITCHTPVPVLLHSAQNSPEQ